MNLKTISTLIIGGAAMAACATAPSTTPAADAPAATATKTAEGDVQAVEVAFDDPHREICKRTRVIGSKFNKRVCKTKAEWDLEEEISRQTAQGFRGRGRAQANPGS